MKKSELSKMASEYGGFILIYRSLKKHPLWQEKPFSKGQAWIDLQLDAYFSDNKKLCGDHFETRKRGTVYKSMQQYAEEWGWDRRKVKRFLMALENDGMVSVEVLKGGTSQGCRITIENYDKFQVEPEADGTSNGTTDGTSNGTSNGTQYKKEEKGEIKENTRACVDETPRDVIPMPEFIRKKLDEVL